MVRFILFASGTISGIGKGNTSGAIGKILMEYFKNNNIGYNQPFKIAHPKDTFDYKIVPIKIDPYLNITPSTINPNSHGEIFVTEDGTESDMDFGIYERSLGLVLSGSNNITGGKLNQIQQKNAGIWAGKTITFAQVYTLIEKMILEAIIRTCLRNYKTFEYKKFDDLTQVGNDIIVLLEIGGTLNDPENVIFLDYLANLKERLEDNGHHYFKTINVDLLPVLGGEIKTKLIQNSIKLFRSKGIPSSLSVCRVSGYKWSPDKPKMLRKPNYSEDDAGGFISDSHSQYETFEEIRNYLSYKNIKNTVISPDLANTYNLPYVLYEQGIKDTILELIGLEIDQKIIKKSVLQSPFVQKDLQLVSEKQKGPLDFSWVRDVTVSCGDKHIRNEQHMPWEIFNPYPWTLTKPGITINVGMVTKYSKNMDSYKSIVDSLLVCGLMENVKVKIVQIDAEEIEKIIMDDIACSKDRHSEKYRVAAISDRFKGIDVVIIPGGFGFRGTEGKIHAIEYCRTQNIPMLGICLGFQLAIIEFLRNVLGLNATSQEFAGQNSQMIFIEDIITQIHGHEKDIVMGPNYYHKAIKIIEGTDRSDSALRLGEKLTILDKDSQVMRIYEKFSRIKSSLADLVRPSTHGLCKIQGKVCICGFCGTDVQCKMSHTGVSSISYDDIKTSLMGIPTEDILIVQERHRHRYELNPKYAPLLELHNFNFVGRDLFNKERYSIFENKNLDFFIGIQYHPEMTTNLDDGHPLFRSLIQEGLKRKLNKLKKKKIDKQSTVLDIEASGSSTKFSSL